MSGTYTLNPERLRITMNIDVTAPANSRAVVSMCPSDARDYAIYLTSDQLDKVIAQLVATKNCLDTFVAMVNSK